MSGLKRLWRAEPVVLRVGLAAAVAAGLLTVTQASVVGDVVAGIVTLVGLFSARGKVSPV